MKPAQAKQSFEHSIPRGGRRPAGLARWAVITSIMSFGMLSAEAGNAVSQSIDDSLGRSDHLTVINYADKPVYATAISLRADAASKAVGVAATGTLTLQLSHADGAIEVELPP